MKLSENFSLVEVTRSTTARKLGIANTPSQEHYRNAFRLIYTVAQPARTALGSAFKINSFYRCPQLNAAIGGSKNSDHMRALAMDLTVSGLTTPEAFAMIIGLDLPIKTGILEFPSEDWSWIHLSCAGIGERINPDRRWLVATRRGGKTVYLKYEGSKWAQ